VRSALITFNPDLKRDNAVALRYYKRLERLFLTLDAHQGHMSESELKGYQNEIGRRQRELQSHGYTVPVTVAQARALVKHFGGEPDQMAI
jgi:hypothetical protein